MQNAREGFCITKSCTESIQKQAQEISTFRGTQGAISTSSAVWKGNFCTVIHKGRNSQVSFPFSNDRLQLWIDSPSTQYRSYCICVHYYFAKSCSDPCWLLLCTAMVTLQKWCWISWFVWVFFGVFLGIWRTVCSGCCCWPVLRGELQQLTCAWRQLQPLFTRAGELMCCCQSIFTWTPLENIIALCKSCLAFSDQIHVSGNLRCREECKNSFLLSISRHC